MQRSSRLVRIVNFAICIGVLFWSTAAASQSRWSSFSWRAAGPLTSAQPSTATECYGPLLEIEAVREDASASNVLRVNDALYVTGRSVELTVVMRGSCSRVESVSYNGIELLRDGNPIEPISNFWEGVSRRRVGTNTEQRIRLHFANIGTGTTKDVRITAHQTHNSARRSTDLTLSAVHAIDAPLTMQIPEEAIRDAIAISLYDTYGDAGHLEIEDSPDASNPSYEHCERPWDSDCLDVRVDDGAINVSFHTDVFLSICTSTARIFGRTRIDFDAVGGPGIEWVEGPDIELDVPLWCGGPAASEIFNNGFAWLIEGKLEAAITEAVDVDIPGCTEACGAFVDRATYDDGIIEIELVALPLPRLTVRVPYGRNPIDEPENYGMQRDANQIWILVPDGLTEICIGRTESGHDCLAYRIGSDGATNWDAPEPRIPDPWPGNTAFHRQRLLARNAVNGVYRDHEELPLLEYGNPGMPIAADIEEGEDRLIYSGTSACRIAAREEGRRMGFGVNDTSATNGGANGRGDFFMHILMVTDGDVVGEAVGLIPNCVRLDTSLFSSPSVPTRATGTNLPLSGGLQL